MRTNADEMFEVFDEAGNPLGLAPRAACHGNPRLIHRTAHVVVFHPDGRLLLQKRAATKDIQPGKWDTAVGGHLQPGETPETAARREMAEELGLDPATPLTFLFESKIRNAIESENVFVFSAVSAGPFHPPADEIDGVRFWSVAECDAALGAGIFTPNLEAELAELRMIGPILRGPVLL